MVVEGEAGPTVAGEDPTAIFALQNQLFNSSEGQDNTLETGINL